MSLLFLLLQFEERQDGFGLDEHEFASDEQEVGQVLRTDAIAVALHIRDELVRDFRQRDIGDVQLVPLDEVQQQIQRPFEDFLRILQFFSRSRYMPCLAFMNQLMPPLTHIFYQNPPPAAK